MKYMSLNFSGYEQLLQYLNNIASSSISPSVPNYFGYYRIINWNWKNKAIKISSLNKNEKNISGALIHWLVNKCFNSTDILQFLS